MNLPAFWRQMLSHYVPRVNILVCVRVTRRNGAVKIEHDMRICCSADEVSKFGLQSFTVAVGESFWERIYKIGHIDYSRVYHGQYNDRV